MTCFVNIDCRHMLEMPYSDGSNEYPKTNVMEPKKEKKDIFLYTPVLLGKRGFKGILTPLYGCAMQNIISKGAVTY